MKDKLLDWLLTPNEEGGTNLYAIVVTATGIAAMLIVYKI